MCDCGIRPPEFGYWTTCEKNDVKRVMRFELLGKRLNLSLLCILVYSSLVDFSMWGTVSKMCAYKVESVVLYSVLRVTACSLMLCFLCCVVLDSMYNNGQELEVGKKWYGIFSLFPPLSLLLLPLSSTFPLLFLSLSRPGRFPVSYTHLTLPTIYSV